MNSCLLEGDKCGSIRGIGALQVLRDFGELWSTFQGAQIFASEYLAHFLSDHDENWQD